MYDASIHLPDVSTEHERRVVSVSFWTSGLDEAIARLAVEKNPAKCRPEILPWLAYEASADFWDPAWPIERQRQAISAQWVIHRYKGTPFALRKALALFDIEMRLIEWWQTDPAGTPGTFKLEYQISDVNQMAQDKVEQVQRAINLTKPLSRHYSIEAKFPLTASVHIGSTSIIKQAVTVLPYSPEQIVLEGAIELGLGSTIRAHVTILPGAIQ